MGVIVNALTVFIGGIVGLVFNRLISEKIADTVMLGIGLIVIVIGISGALSGENTIIQILSIVLGAIIGESLDIDHFFNSQLEKLDMKFSKDTSAVSFSEGFLAATMLMCVGSMTIIGSLEVGLIGDNSTLYAKSILDGISAIIFSSSMGYGVIFAAVPVLLIQGAIALTASFLEPFLAQAVIAEVIAVGSILLIGLGLNILKVTELKIVNYTPAIILPVLLMIFT